MPKKKKQHIMQLYCSKHLNNAFRFFWKAMGLAYANPPFSLLAKVPTKIAYEGGRVVMCTPDSGCSGEHAYWRRMIDRMTLGRVQLPDGPIYVPEDSDTAMQAPEWATFLSIVDGSLNPVPLCDLGQVLLKEVMAENRGLTLSDLKNRSPEHLSATLTGCQSLNGYLEPAAVKEEADDQLSEIASTIPPVDPSCVELKRSAFLAQLLLEEVDLEHGGGRSLGSGRQLPPQTDCWPKAPWGGGGGGGGGAWRGGLGGAPERAVPGGGGRFPGFPWGGVSGTSEQLGMRPRCDPTVRTAPFPQKRVGYHRLGYSQPHWEPQGGGLLRRPWD